MQIRKGLFTLLSITFVVVMMHSAHGADVFTIEDLWIKKTADNASAARNIAYREAERTAFNQLIERLIADEDYHKLPALDAEDITRLVKGFEVSEEKIAGTTYAARFSVSFNAEGIKQLLDDYNVSYLLDKGAPTLVIPIYQEGNTVALWESPNLWREVWENAVDSNSLMPLVIPLGDLDDLQMVSVEDAYSGNYADLQALAEKYEAKDILIVEAQYAEGTVDSNPSLEILMRIVKEGRTERTRANFQGSATQEKQVFLQQAAKNLITDLEKEWRQSGHINAIAKERQVAPSVVVNIPLNGMGDWLALQKRFDTFEFLEKYELKKLSAAEVLVELFYKEDFATFSYFLSVEGFRLIRGEDRNGWILYIS